MTRFQKFPRQVNDSYDTPAEIADIVVPHLDKEKLWLEPCSGANALSNRLEAGGVHIAYRGDIEPRALGIAQADGADIPRKFDGCPIVTNPPFVRGVFRSLLTSWIIEQEREAWILQPMTFLSAAGFQKTPLFKKIADIQTLPRIKWVPGSPHNDSKDHVWVRYFPEPQSTVILHPRVSKG